jgi:hypothetical protein
VSNWTEASCWLDEKLGRGGGTEKKRERVGERIGPGGLGIPFHFFQTFYQMQISLNSNQIQIFE